MHPKGENSMAISRNDLVGTGRAISVTFGINGVGKKRSHFAAFKAHF